MCSIDRRALNGGDGACLPRMRMAAVKISPNANVGPSLALILRVALALRETCLYVVCWVYVVPWPFMIDPHHFCISPKYLSQITKCICLKLQVFVSNCKMCLSQLLNVFVSNCEIFISQMAKCVSLILKIVFVSNYIMYLFQFANVFV